MRIYIPALGGSISGLPSLRLTWAIQRDLLSKTKQKQTNQNNNKNQTKPNQNSMGFERQGRHTHFRDTRPLLPKASLECFILKQKHYPTDPSYFLRAWCNLLVITSTRNLLQVHGQPREPSSASAFQSAQPFLVVLLREGQGDILASIC